MAKITIFGLAGTGTSTVGKRLAAELGYSYHSPGAAFRRKAAELGMNLYQFVELCSREPKYNRELDEEIKIFGEQNDDFLVESRLAWYFIPDSFKIKLVCKLEARLERVAKRDGVSLEEARKKTLFREEEGRKQYQEIYGITDFAPDSLFDCVIDTTTTPVPDIVSSILRSLKGLHVPYPGLK
jgi:cytidylate kinase